MRFIIFKYAYVYGSVYEYVYPKIVPRAQFLSVAQDLSAHTSDKDRGTFVWDVSS